MSESYRSSSKRVLPSDSQDGQNMSHLGLQYCKGVTFANEIRKKAQDQHKGQLRSAQKRITKLYTSKAPIYLKEDLPIQSF